MERLVEATQEGAFNEFRGAAHISAKAARNIIPGLREGLVYSEACARVGYDHSARPAVSLDQINSPVTRRAFGEAIKQIRAVARAFGPIDDVHIELARDVGKSAEERRKLAEGIEERNADKERRRGLAAGILGRPVSDDELLRYELATEQLFKCAYCFGAIAPDGFRADDTRYQVDHILPWSRFGDDSYLNKTLCCTRCNQEKRGRTPFEWFDADKTAEEWETFAGGVEILKEMKGLKKRNFRLKDAASVEDKFKNRNLTDTALGVAAPRRRTQEDVSGARRRAANLYEARRYHLEAPPRLGAGVVEEGRWRARVRRPPPRRRRHRSGGDDRKPVAGDDQENPEA